MKSLIYLLKANKNKKKNPRAHPGGRRNDCCWALERNVLPEPAVSCQSGLELARTTEGICMHDSVGKMQGVL